MHCCGRKSNTLLTSLPLPKYASTGLLGSRVLADAEGVAAAHVGRDCFAPNVTLFGCEL
eukprot:SAG25_NODE_817_length_5224_cov_27.176780_7_plen_59_part_00